jgi:hypothetical protein
VDSPQALAFWRSTAWQEEYCSFTFYHGMALT